MNFSDALKRLKLGAKIHRQSWEHGIYIELSESGKSFTAHIKYNAKIKWQPFDEDILADDWIDPAE
jgi:hypothetical protein